MISNVVIINNNLDFSLHYITIEPLINMIYPASLTYNKISKSSRSNYPFAHPIAHLT